VRPAYPKPPLSNIVDDYHGTRIADPYRVLEDADSPLTRQWVEAQNAMTFAWLEQQPGREALRGRLTELWNFERFPEFYKAGPHYFFFRNSGLQNQPVLYVADSPDGPGRVLIDPNTYRADGTAALSGESVSWSGGLIAYAVAQAGSDWNEWRVRDVGTVEGLADLVLWSKNAAPAWAPDDSGFFYTRFPEPSPDRLLTAASLNEKVYFHRLGNAQDSDRLIFELPEHPDWTLDLQVTEDGSSLLILIEPAVPGVNLLACLDLRDPNASVRYLSEDAGHSFLPIERVDGELYVQTNQGAPRGRIVAIAGADRREAIPESEATLESARIVGGRLLVSYMKDARSEAKIFSLAGRPLGSVELPGLGTAAWQPARTADTEAFYNFTGYTIPPAICRLDLNTGRSAPVRAAKVDFDSAAFETRQVFYRSADGTQVPMFLSARKGLPRDGGNPAILYGYGGFDIALTPGFSPAIAAWMERGGIWAVANLRGGSEYGEAWHKAGMRENKQNVFDDFIAAAEFLVAERYTSPARLAIYGGSNGGLLVGAVLNQRSELFGAAMPAVGVMDMLRFQHFGYGVQWTGEYGSAENPDDFPFLYAYSPLHNIRADVEYPPVLVTTADHDDRVMPGHSLKYAAALQAAGHPLALVRIDTRAGHGAGKPTSKAIGEWVDRFTFLDSALRA
jgi:prolyl oligopeptidase